VPPNIVYALLLLGHDGVFLSSTGTNMVPTSPFGAYASYSASYVLMAPSMVRKFA
jgi:hypothetical protein